MIVYYIYINMVKYLFKKGTNHYKILEVDKLQNTDHVSFHTLLVKMNVINMSIIYFQLCYN